MIVTVNGRAAATVEELDAALDDIKTPAPKIVELVANDGSDFQPMLWLVVGHPHRSSLKYLSATEHADEAVEVGVEPWQGDIAVISSNTGVDYPPEHTRVTPATARRAAHEFLTSGGKLPTCVDWRNIERDS